jgi:C1A family cysteine protease
MESTERGSLEKSLLDLEAENHQLRAMIEKYEKASIMPAHNDVTDQLTKLKESSDRLTDQIKAYAPIAEDVWGLRVFEKAKSYLLGWITLGGITVVVASGALFAGAWKYAVDLIDAKVKAISEKEVSAIVQREVEGQVAKYFNDHSAEYNVHVEELTQQWVRQVNATVQSKLGYGLSESIERNAQPVTAATDSVLDYTSQMGAVRSGGSEGSVVGFAIAYALEYQVFKSTGQQVRLSPREIYNMTRKLEGTISSDAGAQIRNAVKIVQTQGAIAEAVWPYKEGEFSAQPPSGFEATNRYKVKRAHKIEGVDRVDKIKTALSSTGPVVGGIAVYESFMGEDVAKTGIVPMPKPRERVIGGHAICIVGYDNTKQLFKFINSYGDDWGDHGYGYLPYSYIKDNSDDIWSLSMK